MKKINVANPSRCWIGERDLPGAQLLAKVNQSNLVLELQLTSRFHRRAVKRAKTIVMWFVLCGHEEQTQRLNTGES